MSEKVRLSFGMYRGYFVDETPLNYLSWGVDNVRLSIPLQTEIKRVLKDADYPENGRVSAEATPNNPFDVDRELANPSRGQRTIRT